jgi:uncharacterized protein
MLAVLSPSKKLDVASPVGAPAHSQPSHLDAAKTLVESLRGYDVDGLRSLMGISEKLARLNTERFDQFSPPFHANNARPALCTFKGDVYHHFELADYESEDWAFAQAHLRILSGLYGCLRPLDLMQPYRLEMGTSLPNAKGSNLYSFWSDTITTSLGDALIEQGDDVLINLASDEYFRSIDVGALNARVIKIVFKDFKNGAYKVISFFAKKARGAMANHMVRHKISTPDALRECHINGYHYSDEQSQPDTFVFLRDSNAKQTQ